MPRRSSGAPPGRPPAATRPLPRSGGLGGISVPPEIRRRADNGVPSAPAAQQAEARVRVALRKARRKLLDSRQKLQSSVDALRARLASRR